MNSIFSTILDTAVKKVVDEIDIELQRKLKNTTAQKIKMMVYL